MEPVEEQSGNGRAEAWSREIVDWKGRENRVVTSVGQVLVSRGATASEANLLEELRRQIAQWRTDVTALRTPIRVIVPSRSLREHLSARLVETCGRAVAGVAIQTLSAVVASILARAGQTLPANDALFAVMIRQLAREVASLREPLDPLRNGYAAVEGAVADLLDAGLERAHAEPLIDRIAELASGALATRASAVIRVAAAASELIETIGVGHASNQLRRARELLEIDPEGALPAQSVFVFGFADATGVQTDLIEVLVRRHRAQVCIDHPPDPGDLVNPDPGAEFSQRFSARLLAVTGGEPTERAGRVDAPRIEVVRAPGREAEARAVADRVRQQLDDGVQPERIAVIARDLDGYRNFLRVHFRRLGVPLSGIAELGPAGPAGRRIAGLQALVRTGRHQSLDGWLETLGALPDSPGGRPLELTLPRRARLRSALHARGITSLDAVAALDSRTRDKSASPSGSRIAPARERLPLGSTAPPLGSHQLAAASQAARRLIEELEGWPGRGSLGDYLGALHRLLDEQLYWPVDAEMPAELADLLGDPALTDFALEREDFLLYLERRLVGAGRVPLGGSGGGVQVLSVMEARSRTFDQLFLIGLGRGVFPRSIREDPLLPDALRRGLRALLPDLPVKREGVDEERYLFAQLLSSSNAVTASYPAVGDDGRTLSISPLLGRLRGDSDSSAPGLWEPRSAADAAASSLRPAYEHAVVAGLRGSRAHWARALRAAAIELDADVEGVGLRDAGFRASVRAAVVAEWDGRTAAELGPYFGFVGELREPMDPRLSSLSITTLEKIAACPWQAFLGELLRIGAIQNAGADLPSLEPRVLGKLVHSVLQEIAGEYLPADPEALTQLVQRAPVKIPWPHATQLGELLLQHAEQLLAEEGVTTPGFARVLAARARGLVEIAGRSGWPGPGSDSGVLGVEVAGEVEIPDAAGGERRVQFRADRVDRAGERLRLVDYKTGGTVAGQRCEERRREVLRKQIAKGSALQAPAYAVAAAQLEARGEGQYAHLRPDVQDHARVSSVTSDDRELTDAFFESASTVIDVIDRGSFFPRLIESTGESEPRRCQSCQVKEACLRGDSGARRRLERWIGSREHARRDSAQGALLRLWKLGGES